MRIWLCLCLSFLFACQSSKKSLSYKFMDNATHYGWHVDTARLRVNLVLPASQQLEDTLDTYVREMKAFPDYDKRLKPKIYVAFDVLNGDTTMRIYMDHAVSMHGMESYLADTSRSPFCGTFRYLGIDISIQRNMVDESCFEGYFQERDSSRIVDYAYDFSIRDGKVRMVNNYPWSYSKKYLLRGNDFILIEKKYVPAYKSSVSEGHLH